MVENTGQRNSAVNHYEVNIKELGQSFSNLSPCEGWSHIDGRYSGYALQPANVMSSTGIITVRADDTTYYRLLPFFIPDIATEQFLKAGLQANQYPAKFADLNCLLTLIDTNGSSASCEFCLHEG